MVELSGLFPDETIVLLLDVVVDQVGEHGSCNMERDDRLSVIDWAGLTDWPTWSPDLGWFGIPRSKLFVGRCAE